MCVCVCVRVCVCITITATQQKYHIIVDLKESNILQMLLVNKAISSPICN